MRFSRFFVGSRSSFAFFLLPLLAGARSHAQECEAVRIVPPHETVEGKTLGEWSVEWWRWALSVPLDAQHPFNEGPCAEGQDPNSPVFFLVGNLGGTAPPRTCTVPCGKRVFFPIVNAVFTAPLECADCGSCTNVTRSTINSTFLLECEIDNQDVPVEELFRHREESPDCFDHEVVGEGHFYPPGHYDIAFADGHWLMLEPLCAGKQHSIVFKGGTGPPPCGNDASFCVDISYTLEVGPCLFRRGDADGNGSVNITDPIFILNSLFAGGGDISCRDAADTQDDGKVDLADAVYTLNALFNGGPALPSPGPDACGTDPTKDELEACTLACS